jgi:hypothetical protein
MPRAEELPASLAKLVRRQALELNPGRFEADTRRLLRVLDRTISMAPEEASQEAGRAARYQEKIEQLPGQIRERAGAQDWDAVVAVNDQPAALDPAAADPDALASTAGEQIARRRQAEEAAVRRKADERAQREAGKASPVATESQPVPPRLETTTTSLDFGSLTHHSASPELSIRLGNAGGGNLNAHAATRASWIRLRQTTDGLYAAADTGTVGTHEGVIMIDSDGGSATILVKADIVAAPQTAPATPASAKAAPVASRTAEPDRPHDTALVKDVPATARASPPGETTQLLAHQARSAARLVDAGFMILAILLCVIALEALIRQRTPLTWPWWVIIAAGILGVAITLGGFRHHAVPATIAVWVMTWSAVYSLSVIGAGDSSPSTPITVLSTECIVGAVVSVALCIWIVVLLPKGIRGADPFLAIFLGCFSAALVLAAIALHTRQAGVWTAAGVATLAAALGVILTLIQAQRPRSVSS